MIAGAVYVGQFQLPLHWQNETSGVLSAAVKAYLDNRIDGVTITDENISLLRDYLEYHINAPCWDGQQFDGELAALRASVRELDSATEISEWLSKAMEIGLDPL